MTRPIRYITNVIVLLCLGGVVALAGKDPYKTLTADERLDGIRRAQLWTPTDVASADVKAGPHDVPSFSPEATVTCDYVEKEVTGTPKFWCAVAPGDDVKVKFGDDNGEVYGEVAATRLLWALGFGADRMYPVKVVCRGCPKDPMKASTPRAPETTFDVAVIERPLPGDEMETGGIQGWEWVELNFVDPGAGGAPLAHRDALRLLAALIQHTDSKRQQQRLLCLDRALAAAGRCARPFMMVNDLGRTFGKANLYNKDTPGSVDLKAWSSEPVWKDKTGCTANISRSMTGTLEHPKISEEGRQFLAGLLARLSDAQIRDLFEVARFARRDPSATVDDWVAAFKTKRQEVSSRSCAG